MLTSGLTSALVQIMDELGTDGGTYVVGIKPRSQASALPLIQPGMRLVGVGHRDCSRLLCVQFIMYHLSPHMRNYQTSSLLKLPSRIRTRQSETESPLHGAWTMRAASRLLPLLHAARVVRGPGRKVS